MTDITSLQNPEVKHIVKLHEAKERKKHNQCIAEGFRTLSTMLQSTIKLIKLYVTEEHYTTALTLASKEQIVTVSVQVMKKMSAGATPSGFLGLFEIPVTPLPHHLSAGLVLAQISDPGNMGTLIRTAVACKVSSVVIVEGVDPWSAKVIQSSAGTISWIQIFELSWQTLIQNKKDLQLCALVVSEGIIPTELNPAKSLLVVGNEAHGIPSLWQQQCDQSVTLPMPGKTESLNAAIAGSIALYWTFVQKLC